MLLGRRCLIFRDSRKFLLITQKLKSAPDSQRWLGQVRVTNDTFTLILLSHFVHHVQYDGQGECRDKPAFFGSLVKAKLLCFEVSMHCYSP
jgi:hypothetical protein